MLKWESVKWGWGNRDREIGMGMGNGDGKVGMEKWVWGWGNGDEEMGTGKEIAKCSENRLEGLGMGKWVRRVKVGNEDKKYMVWRMEDG